MSELQDAIALANRILDRPHGDPDDDLAVLSRQLLRRVEAVEGLQRQHAEDERLLREAHAALSLGRVRGVCSWCGLEIYGEADPADRIREHLHECPKHPMRAVEGRVADLEADLAAAHDPHGDLVAANRDAILRIREEGLAKIAKVVDRYCDERAANAMGAMDVRLVRKIITAVNTFHPMHGESFSWPEGS